jgi:uncharacterized membrane-anchored protein
MIKNFFTVLNMTLLLGIAIFLSIQEGHVSVAWDNQFYTVRLGLALVVAFVGIILLLQLSNLVNDLFYLPKEWARARSDRKRAKGYQSLLRALSAAAAGDHKSAYLLAQKAKALMPQAEEGLPLLVQAHAARNRGEESHADTAFQALMQHADTALLGAQGLMQKAILNGDHKGALQMARDAAKTQPQIPQLLKPVYDLELRNKLWSDAFKTLEALQKKKILTKEEIIPHRRALYHVLADHASSEERRRLVLKAYDTDKNFTPSILRMAELYVTHHQTPKAENLLRKAWREYGDGEVFAAWMNLCRGHEKYATHVHRDAVELVAYHPENVTAQLKLAELEIEKLLWGEARITLAKIEKLDPVKDVYLLWVTLEEKTQNRHDVIRQWLDRAANVSPLKTGWICTVTARHFDKWQAVVEPEGLFNTLKPARETSTALSIV